MNGTSPEMVAQMLQLLNGAKAQLYIPILLYMLVLMVVGVIGNSLVVYVYLQRFKRTSWNYLILTMAMFDMVTCCVDMPAAIYDLRYPYLFHNDIACKVFRFAGYAAAIGSALTLLVLAFDRYFKICRPLKHIPLTYVKSIILCIWACAFLMAISSLFVSGVKDVVTSYPGVVGKGCHRMNVSGQPSAFSLTWFAALMTFFLFGTVTMIILHIRIWAEIKRHRRQVFVTQLSKSSGDASGSSTIPFPEPPPKVDPEKLSSVKYLPNQSINSDLNGDVEVTYNTRDGTPSRMGVDASDSKDAAKKSIRPNGENNFTRIKSNRTIVILFCAAVAAILSSLPSLVVGMVQSRASAQLSNKDDLVMQLFAKSYYINNSINPIIYSFLNVRFRSECAKALGKLCQVGRCGFTRGV